MSDESDGSVNLEVKLGSDGGSVPGHLERMDDGFVFAAQISDLGPRHGNSLAVSWWDTKFCRELDRGGAGSPEMNAYGYSTKLEVNLDDRRRVEVEFLRRGEIIPGDGSKVRDRIRFAGAESEAEVAEVLGHFTVVRCNVRSLSV